MSLVTRIQDLAARIAVELNTRAADALLRARLSDLDIFIVLHTTGTTAPSVLGGTIVSTGTLSYGSPSAGSIWQSSPRKLFNAAATAGTGFGLRTAFGQWFRGANAGQGGFYFRCRFGQSANQSGTQMFVGLAAQNTALATSAGAVAALVNMIGMGYDTTDANTGNWYLYTNDASGTATKTDLGANAARNSSDGYDLIIQCAPNDTKIRVSVVNVNTNTVALAATDISTDIPAATSMMCIHAEGNNAAAALIMNIHINKLYCESRQTA